MKKILLAFLILSSITNINAQISSVLDSIELINKIKIKVIADFNTYYYYETLSSSMSQYFVEPINTKGFQYSEYKLYRVKEYNIDPLIDSLYKTYVVENCIKLDTFTNRTKKLVLLANYYNINFANVDSLIARFGKIVNHFYDDEYIIAYNISWNCFFQLKGFRTSDFYDFINFVVKDFEPNLMIEFEQGISIGQTKSEMERFYKLNKRKKILFLLNYMQIEGLDLTHEYKTYSKIAKKNKYSFDHYNKSSITRKNRVIISL